MKPLRRPAFVLIAGLVLCLSGVARSADDPPKTDDAAAVDDNAARYRQFEERMSGAILDGQFTITGRDTDSLPQEQYTIRSVTKLTDGDYWLFKARIKYGDKDVTLPLPLEVKWAGDTPVITLTKLTIPGLGTFSSRVVIDGDKYAGTWTHDEVGGHMFGMIRKAEPESP